MILDTLLGVMKLQLKSLVFLAGLSLLASVGYAEEIVENGNFQTGGWWLGDTSTIKEWNESPMSGGGNRFSILGGTNSDEMKVWNNCYFGFNPGTAFMSFDFTTDQADVAGFDFMVVTIGNTVIDTIDLGGNTPGWSRITTKNYDVSQFAGHLSNSVEFKVLTDFSAPTRVAIDNVSINYQPVPEPATMAVIGLGLVGFARRRRNK